MVGDLVSSSLVILCFILDTEKPVFNKTIMNISETTDPGLPFAVVTWHPVSATDNSGSVIVMSNYQSGDSFPIGNTDVVYNATDPTGNLVTATFVVTVKGRLHFVAEMFTYFYFTNTSSKSQCSIAIILAHFTREKLPHMFNKILLNGQSWQCNLHKESLGKRFSGKLTAS